MAGSVKDREGWISARAEPKRMIAPQLQPASITVASKSGGTLAGLFGQRLDFTTQATVDSPYAQSSLVHACLKPGGQAMAQIPAQVWDKEPETHKDAKRIEPGQHELADLFVNPNAHQTQSQLFESGFLHRRLDGTDYWLQLGKDDKPIAKLGETPRRIIPVRGKCVSYRADKRGWPAEYRISFAGGQSESVPPHALLRFADYNPDSPVTGLSDTDVVLPEIDLAWQAYRYQRAIIENAGDPGGWIEGMENLAPEERQAAEKEVEEEIKLYNAGRWRALAKGRKYVPNKLTPRDMEYLNLLKYLREQLASNYGVPLPVIGVLDHATYNNLKTAFELFWKGGNGLLSYARSVEDVITNQFFRRLRDARAQTFVFRFDLRRVEALREDKKLQIEIAAKLLALGRGFSKNEAYRLVDLEVDEDDVKYGDVALVPPGLTTMDATLSLAENPPEEETEDDDPKKPDPPKDDKPKDEDKKSVDAPAPAPAEPVAPTKTDAEIAYEERTAYWREKEMVYLAPSRAKVASKYKGWRQKFEAAQIKRIKDFAAGKSITGVARAMDDDGRIDPTHLEPSDVEPLLLSMEEWRKKMDAAMRKSIADVFHIALEDLADELGAEMLSPNDSNVLLFLNLQLASLTEGHLGVLKDRVVGALIEGLSKATNIGTLQQLVAEVLPDLEDVVKQTFADKQSRALTIARTETAHASNGARNLQMVAAGVEEHEWITSRDENVRGAPGGPYEDAEFSHAALEGVTAKLGQDFVDKDGVTHKGLTHPSDPDADPGDSINCRCMSRPVRKTASDEDEPL